MSRTEFEPPSPGSWSVLARVEATHEAAHAVMAHEFGLRIFEVRIDRPLYPLDNKPGLVHGHCIHEKPARADLWKNVAITLAPLILTNRCPEYPPQLNSDDGDERSAAALGHEISMSEEEWDNTVEIARVVLRLPVTKRRLTALSGALLERGALPGDEVDRILGGGTWMTSS